MYFKGGTWIVTYVDRGCRGGDGRETGSTGDGRVFFLPSEAPPLSPVPVGTSRTAHSNPPPPPHPRTHPLISDLWHRGAATRVRVCPRACVFVRAFVPLTLFAASYASPPLNQP